MRFVPTAAVLATAFLAACDVADLQPFGSGASRPPVTVAKEVTMVSAAELVGTWSCRELNPYPDQPPTTTTIVLGADDRFSSETLLPMAETMPGAGDMLMTTSGDWRVEGDRLITFDTEVEIAAADGSEDPLSSMMQSAAAFLVDQAGDGDAEVFRVTASELVMRANDPDAPTVACLRQG
jgi:hypothetical protein